MPKNDITWKARREDGTRCEVRARMTNNQWAFQSRAGRFERWEPHPEPPLVDWLELHDGLERRIGRGLYRPQALQALRKAILERFPGTELP